MDRVVEASRNAGILSGRFMARLDETETLLQAGIQYIVFSTDTGLLMNCCRSAAEYFKDQCRNRSSSRITGAAGGESDLVARITAEVLRRLGRTAG
jgi:hypothetical protein